MLRNTREMWDEHPANLTRRQRDLLAELLAQALHAVRAYRLAERSDDSYELDDPDTAEQYLRRWVSDTRSTELEPISRFLPDPRGSLGSAGLAGTKATSAWAAGNRSIAHQGARRRPRCRSNRNFITMSWLMVGKLTAGPANTQSTETLEKRDETSGSGSSAGGLCGPHLEDPTERSLGRINYGGADIATGEVCACRHLLRWVLTVRLRCRDA